MIPNRTVHGRTTRTSASASLTRTSTALALLHAASSSTSSAAAARNPQSHAGLSSAEAAICEPGARFSGGVPRGCSVPRW